MIPTISGRRLFDLVALVAWALSTAVQAADDEYQEPPKRSSFLVGASVAVAPEYAGSDRQAAKPGLLYAYQYGRWRISTSRAGSMLGFGEQVRGSGASAEFVADNKWKFGAGLRIDSGRSSSDSDRLAGLPDVRTTLRARLYAVHELAPMWSVGASLSQDLLGRGGGATLGLDLGYRRPLGPDWVFSAGGGLSLADGRYMQSYYGVSQLSSQQTGIAAYDAGAGLRDVHAGFDLTTALAPRWIAFFSAGISQLQGDAAASPLTRSRSGWSVGAGLAYRCCH